MEDLQQRIPHSLCWAIRDPRHEFPLPHTEVASVFKSVPKRRKEFSAGRDAARDALAQMGHANAVIPKGANRAPVWPKGVCGSISHSDTQCIAIAGRSSDYSALGVDVEPLRPLSADLRDTILHRDESHVSNKEATRIFSMKEAVYKAIAPGLERMISFHDLSICKASDPDHYTARLCTDAGPFEVGQNFDLSVYDWRGHVLALCAVPAKGA